jgi:hypothetical protein
MLFFEPTGSTTNQISNQLKVTTFTIRRYQLKFEYISLIDVLRVYCMC